MRTEQGVLRISIAVTFVLAGFGILFGLMSGSFAIIFDGVYSLTDASMTIVALLVSNLIVPSTAGGSDKSKLVARFTMGFWHLEPMVLGMNGAMLMGVSDLRADQRRLQLHDRRPTPRVRSGHHLRGRDACRYRSPWRASTYG